MPNGKFPYAPFTTVLSGITRVWHMAHESLVTSTRAFSQLNEGEPTHDPKCTVCKATRVSKQVLSSLTLKS